MTPQPDEFTQGLKSGFNSQLDEVKNYLMGLYNKAQQGPLVKDSTLSGLENMIKQQQVPTPPPEGYANGGLVPDQEPPIQFNPQAGLPPPPQIQTQAPQMPISAPNPINHYLDSQKQQLNKFGPEQQLALSQALIKQRQSPGALGAVALGGIGDAISSVGGRSTNYMGNIQDQQNKLAGEQTSALEKAGSQNIQRTEANQKLDAMDPRSELSKVAQQTWGPLLAQNGFKPDQIANMPASSIAALTGQSVEALKAKAEAEMAKASLGLNTQRASEEVRHNIQGENIAKGNLEAKNEEDRRKNLQNLTSPVNAMLHPVNAWSASKELNSIATNPADPEHQTAIQWAQAHPNDPRAARILSLHGGQ